MVTMAMRDTNPLRDVTSDRGAHTLEDLIFLKGRLLMLQAFSHYMYLSGAPPPPSHSLTRSILPLLLSSCSLNDCLQTESRVKMTPMRVQFQTNRKDL